MRKRRSVNGAEVLKFLKTHPCVDCGESDPIMLDFDHVRGEKSNNIAKMISSCSALSTIFEEIRKCEVRCSNCHRKKTAELFGYFRFVNSNRSMDRTDLS